MRPRTFAREIAFQVLYRDDLNPKVEGAVVYYDDDYSTRLRSTRELMEFVGHLAELQELEDAGPEYDPAMFPQWLGAPPMVEFTRTLIEGVSAHVRDLDERIGRAAAHWSLDRMAATDRNLLRLGAYEMLFTETPPKVAIDESIELAKRFGGAQSAQFVNGILDNLLRQKEAASQPASAETLVAEAVLPETILPKTVLPEKTTPNP